jgi:predicted dehydrogenase
MNLFGFGTSESSSDARKVRYAVVGLGHIAQVAVLPAFAHARENSELVAFVSGDGTKREELAQKYRVNKTYSYDEYDSCLKSGEIDAVYIALPNHLHCEYAVRAAEAGIHVLCEKPMAVTEAECKKMIHAAKVSDVRLMIAYRLHFEEANLKAIEIVKSGQLGEPRIFNSVFTMQVRDGNVRVDSKKGGGTLYDIGIYCINAARYLFQSEPTEVTAFSANNGDPRFAEIDEMTSALLRFPGDRLVTFTASFGAADVSSYRVVGTEGDLRLEPAYGYATELTQHLTVKGKMQTKVFPKRDQFAPGLIEFSKCVIEQREPECSGEEGLADVHVIRSLYRSAQTGKPIQVSRIRKSKRPSLRDEKHKPAVSKPRPIHAQSPSK